MNALRISQIFAQLSFYQAQYLDILKDSARYYTPVEGAEIRLWPLAAQPLFLGDLLQLWFSEKWSVEKQQQFSFELFLNPQDVQSPEKDFFIYAIEGNVLTGSNRSQAWQGSAAQPQQLNLSNISKYYFEFKALTRPAPVHKAALIHPQAF